MNAELGFNTIILLILFFIPGYLFRRFYFQGEFTKQFQSKDWAYNISVNTIVGSIIQIWCFVIFKKLIKALDYKKDILKLAEISTIDDVVKALSKFDIIYFIKSENVVILMTFYFLIICLISLISSSCIWKIVRLFKLDRKYTIFRFNNHWNYYFNGEIKDMNDFSFLPKGRIAFTEADILTQTASGETKLFSGILSQYTIDPKTNQLKNLYLTKVKRWKRNENQNYTTSISRIKYIKSHCFIIPFSSVLEINLNYTYIDENEIKTKRLNNLNLLTSLAFLIGIGYVFTSSYDLFMNYSSLTLTIIKKTIYSYFIALIITIISSFIAKLFIEKNFKEKSKEFFSLLGSGVLHFVIFQIIRWYF